MASSDRLSVDAQPDNPIDSRTRNAAGSFFQDHHQQRSLCHFYLHSDFAVTMRLVEIVHHLPHFRSFCGLAAASPVMIILECTHEFVRDRQDAASHVHHGPTLWSLGPPLGSAAGDVAPHFWPGCRSRPCCAIGCHFRFVEE